MSLCISNRQPLLLFNYYELKVQKDTIYFVSYNYTRNLFSVTSKLVVPFWQILICYFSRCVENLLMQKTVSCQSHYTL